MAAARALTPKYCSKTRRATGAAVSPPWPPFSISTQTTIGGLPLNVVVSYGPQPHHQAWSRSPEWITLPLRSRRVTTFSAVPVLPAIGTGNVPKTPEEVP